MNAIFDRTGRVVIPVQVRESLNLFAGTKLEVLVQGTDIILRVPKVETIKEEKGMYLVQSEWIGETDIQKIIQKSRSNRAKEIISS